MIFHHLSWYEVYAFSVHTHNAPGQRNANQGQVLRNQLPPERKLLQQIIRERNLLTQQQLPQPKVGPMPVCNDILHGLCI